MEGAGLTSWIILPFLRINAKISLREIIYLNIRAGHIRPVNGGVYMVLFKGE
jgi:hypothetical protein